MKRAGREAPSASRAAKAPDGGGKVRQCSCCSRMIQGEYYIRCMQCKSYILCLQCFSAGRESSKHKKSHNFAIMPINQISIFSIQWSPEEELLLLDSIRESGFGNWEQISAIVGSKSPIECQTHYQSIYLDSPTAPFHYLSDIDPPFPKKPREYSLEGVESNPRTIDDSPSALNTLGYLAAQLSAREEFDHPYLENGERLIEGISFSESLETQASFDEKMAAIEAYDMIVRARKSRSEFTISHGLTKIDVSEVSECKVFGCELEDDDSIRPLLRFIPSSERETISRAYKAEKELRLRKACSVGEKSKLTEKLVALLSNPETKAEEIEEWNLSAPVINDANFDRFNSIVTPGEVSLTRKLKISPSDYLGIRDRIVEESVSDVGIDAKAIKRMFPHREAEAYKVFNFLSKNGMIEDRRAAGKKEPKKVETDID